MTSRSSKQHGFMTVMFLLLLGLFLTFAAFALDLGNMYLWQLRLDKAARAGALAGLGARGLQGWTASNGTEIVQNAAQAAVSENLLSYASAAEGSSFPEGVSVFPFFDPTGDRLTIKIDYRMPTILVGRIKNALGYGFGESVDSYGRTVAGPETILRSSYQTAQVSAANVVLMLDVSGSMLCPITDPFTFAGQPPCACRRSADLNACGSSPTKLAQMAQGVANFVSRFNPDRDRIAVIPFNLAARRLFSFRTFNNPWSPRFGANLKSMTLTTDITLPSETLQKDTTTAWELLTNPTKLTDALTTLAGSNTNHCDALAEGIDELEFLSRNILVDPTGSSFTGREADRRKLQPFVVFFTDGAPNAMRGIFPDASTKPGGDFYHYALEWVVPNETPGQPPKTYRGPGPFVERKDDGGDPSHVQPLFKFAISAGKVKPDGSESCGTERSNFYDFEKTVTKNTTVARGGSQGCLDDTTTQFNFAIPYTNFDPEGGKISGGYVAGVTNVPISTGTTTWRDPNWPPTTAAVPAYGLQKYDELPYYCAIEAADYLRLHFGATIFAIGLGPTNAHSATLNVANDSSCNDPLMDADDHSGRKDFFLSRLAFSRQIFTDQLFPTTISPHYQININGPQQARTVNNCQQHRYKTLGAPGLNVGYTSSANNHSTSLSEERSDTAPNAFKALRPFRPVAIDGLNPGREGKIANYRRIDTQGEYFPTNDPNEVPSIFSNIAKMILLRSTS